MMWPISKTIDRFPLIFHEKDLLNSHPMQQNDIFCNIFQTIRDVAGD